MGKITFEEYADQVKYERPTVPVRQRPYIFLYESQFRRLDENQVIQILPQGNLADGNRVTWGHKITVIKVSRNDVVTVNFQGMPILLDVGINTFELIDTTKNIGVDKTHYTIFSAGGQIQIHHIEQLLVKSPV